MPITWDALLVATSVIVAIIGSFTAMLHANNMRYSQERTSWAWMAIGGVTLGLAIWSMHFIGMLAFHVAIPISFDQNLTLLSAVPAIAAAMLGFFVVRKPLVDTWHLVIAGIVMGFGISAMHYTGMAALKMAPPIQYSPAIVVLSVAIAIVAAWGALLMMCRGDRIRLSPFLRLCLGGIVMGLAISGMHYTAMQGIGIVPGSVCLSGPARIDRNVLAIVVSIVSMLWFIGGMVATGFHKHIAELNVSAERMARAMTQELRESEEKMRAIIDASLDCIITINQNGQIVEFNRAAELTFGCTAKNVIGRDLAEIIIPPAQRDRHREGMKNYMRTGQSRIIGKRMEMLAQRMDGREFPAELTIIKLNRAGSPLLTGFLRDITDRKKAEEEINKLAFYDPLTGLPNRRLMRDRLQHAIVSSTRNLRYGAVLFIDLDNFKTLNDTRGHEFGDLLLVEIAKRLQTCIRTNDTITRLGGDEFVIVLEDLDGQSQTAAIEAERIAEKIRLKVGETCFLDDLEYHTTCSIGISLYHTPDISSDELLKRADSAMYQAKHAGRNTLRFFDPEMQATLEDRAALEHDLRYALEKGEFQLYFQPQVDAEYNIISAELLLRWVHPQRGMVSPSNFIPLAEQTDLILPIGLWVLEYACLQLAKWQRHPLTKNLELAVNVSARQFQQPDFVEQVRFVLERTKAPPRKLKLELTESLMLASVEDSIGKMEALRSLGIRFSMDDFGTGHSSLSYLKRLPLSQLKIDQSFVRDIADDPNDAAIVQTIIAMAKTLGLAVIAEGVESSRQLGHLQNYGCQAFQGYLFGKPVPYPDFMSMLETESDAGFVDAQADI